MKATDLTEPYLMDRIVFTCPNSVSIPVARFACLLLVMVVERCLFIVLSPQDGWRDAIRRFEGMFVHDTLIVRSLYQYT